MKTADPITPEVQAILADVRRRGLTLQADDGKLLFRPRSAMTPDLAERIKTHRPALLVMLFDTTAPALPPNAPHEAESGVSSVLSVSEPSKALWSEDELAMLDRAGKTPADLHLLAEMKDVFAEFGATVVSIATEYGRGGHARRLAGQLIRKTRRQDRGKAVAMRDAWAERLAVCTIAGGFSEDHAEQVALNELQIMLFSEASNR